MNTNFDDTVLDALDTPDTQLDQQGDAGPDEEKGEGHSQSLSSLLELFSRVGEDFDDDADEDDDEDDDDDDSEMGANDIHNKAVNYARRGLNRMAAEICMDGLKKHPYNVDLLADTIQYSSESGDMENAAMYYSILKENVPLQRWNWRAFTFAFEYLLKENPIGNEGECRTIVENYKKYLPYEEKASMAESELEEALGHAETSMNVLVKAIHTHSNASQCALRLADMQMDRGLYEEVVATTNYGIAASARVQPSINVPYLYYIRALAKDYILHNKEFMGERITKEELNALKEEYALLLSEFPELLRHVHTIKMRVKMLKFVKAE